MNPLVSILEGSTRSKMNFKGTALIVAILVVAFSALMFEKHHLELLNGNFFITSLGNFDGIKGISSADIKGIVDVDNSGDISKSETKALLVAVHAAEPGGEPVVSVLVEMDSNHDSILAPKEIDMLNPALDTNEDGKVSPSESLDFDQNGKVTKIECAIALNTPGECMIDTDNNGVVSVQEADKAASFLDTNHDGKTNLADFADLNRDDTVTTAEAAEFAKKISESSKDANGDGEVSLTERLDNNGDGTVSSEECKATLNAPTCPFDSDKDGIITVTELSSSSIHKSFDTNNDNVVTVGEVADKDRSGGVLSAEEFEYAIAIFDLDNDGVLSAFELMDQNKDGKITLQECKLIIEYFKIPGLIIEKWEVLCEIAEKTEDGDISISGATNITETIKGDIPKVIHNMTLADLGYDNDETSRLLFLPAPVPAVIITPDIPQKVTDEDLKILISKYLKNNHWTDSLNNAAWGYIIWIIIEIILMDVFFVKVHPIGLILINLEILILLSSWTPLKEAFLAGDFKPYFQTLLSDESLSDLAYQSLTCFFMLGAFAAEVKTLMDGWALLFLAVSGVLLVYMGVKRVHNEVLNYQDSWMDNADQFFGGMFVLATLIIIMDIFFADVDYEQHHSYFGAILLLLAVIYEAVELWTTREVPHDWSKDTLTDIAYFLLPALIFFSLMMSLDHNGKERSKRREENVIAYDDECRAAGKDPEVHTNRNKFVQHYHSTRSHDTVLRDGRHIFS